MKKKLEAELISIAHRILKLKNRAELDQLQQETLKLYEKLSVLKFVEDNFADVKPTIGYSSAEGKLEEIYGIEEQPEVKANEQEAEEEKERAAQKKEREEEKKEAKGKQDKGNASGEGVDANTETDEAPVSEEEKEYTEEETDEEAPAADEENLKDEAENVHAGEAAEKVKEGNEGQEPAQKIEIQKPEEEKKAMEESAAAVFEKEDKSTMEEEEQAADAEMITIAPDEEVKVEDSGASFELAFERKPAHEEPKKEISFEDFEGYQEPEFVRKDTDAPKAAQDPDDWRNWEPAKASAAEDKTKQLKEEPKKEMPKQESKKSLNDTLGKTISLGLNDRIAFEKHLFGGSSEDLNRVLSQLNTFDNFDDARNFIEDLVKPDYNNWEGKEEYAERFMGLVEKKFD